VTKEQRFLEDTAWQVPNPTSNSEWRLRTESHALGRLLQNLRRRVLADTFRARDCSPSFVEP